MSLTSDIDDFIGPILQVFATDLSYRMNGYIVAAYIQGSMQMISWGRTVLEDKPIYFEGPPQAEAINYADKRCAMLVTKIDEETKEQLRTVIANAIEEKKGIPGLAKDIRDSFDNMSKYRSQMIARTETCDALEQSFMDRSSDMGVTGKEWVTFDPCPICEANEAEGQVPLDYEFSSGHKRPPAHPNCRCALAPVMLK